MAASFPAIGMTRRPVAYLTGRELEIVHLLGDGLTAKEIAARLRISHWTVLAHISNARNRTSSLSTTQLVLRFRKRTVSPAPRSATHEIA